MRPEVKRYLLACLKRRFKPAPLAEFVNRRKWNRELSRLSARAAPAALTGEREDAATRHVQRLEA